MHDRFTRLLTIPTTRGGRTALLASVTAVLVAICVIFGSVMVAWHADVGRALGASGQNVASSVAHEVDRNVELLDLSIQAVAQQWSFEEVRNLAPHLRDMVLFDNSMHAPGFGMILVVDRDGSIKAGSVDGWSPDTRLDDRDYFKVHAMSPDLGLFVSKPFVSRLSGRRSIALSRRMTDGAGGFAGVVVGTIDLEYLSSVYAGLTVGTGDAVALFRIDGTVIAREPPPPTTARPWIGDQDGFTLMRSSRSGTFEGTSPIDDSQKIVSYHRIGDLPLIQVVEVSGEAVYGTWWRRATAVAGLLAVLSLCVLGLCLALTLELGRRAAAEVSLRRIAGTDPLTGLANRRTFDVALATAWSEATANGEEVALLMADADAFKAYNDLFGHHAGDEILLRVAGCLDALAQDRGGIACRWGGEEFTIVLRGITEPEALAMADEFCRSVRELGLPHPRGIGGVVTVSVGVAVATPSSDVSARALLTSADAALYRAKAEGRDCSRARPRPRPIPNEPRPASIG